jgi:hypothetical protein
MLTQEDFIILDKGEKEGQKAKARDTIRNGNLWLPSLIVRKLYFSLANHL